MKYLIHLTPLGYGLVVYAAILITLLGATTGLLATFTLWLVTVLISAKVLGHKCRSKAT